MQPSVSLADRVRTLRTYVDASARTVADVAGVSHSLVALIEAGVREDPRSSTISALARAFGVSSDWISEGRGAEPEAAAVRECFEKARAARAEAAA